MIEEKEEEKLEKDLRTIQLDSFNKIPVGKSIFFISVNFSYDFKTYDLEISVERTKSFLNIALKRLSRYKRRFHNRFDDFVVFFENKNNTEPWHFHMIATFIDQEGVQLDYDFVKDCMKKACSGLKKKHNLSGNIDCDVKFVPYTETLPTIAYCTKDLIQRQPTWTDLTSSTDDDLDIEYEKKGDWYQKDIDYNDVEQIQNFLIQCNKLNIAKKGKGIKTLEISRLYYSRTLFDKPKPHSKSNIRNKNQRKTRTAKTRSELAGVLRTKYAVEINKNARRTQIKL